MQDRRSAPSRTGFAPRDQPQASRVAERAAGLWICDARRNATMRSCAPHKLAQTPAFAWNAPSLIFGSRNRIQIANLGARASADHIRPPHHPSAEPADLGAAPALIRCTNPSAERPPILAHAPALIRCTNPVCRAPNNGSLNGGPYRVGAFPVAPTRRGDGTVNLALRSIDCKTLQLRSPRICSPPLPLV